MKITHLIPKNRKNISRLLCIAAFSSCSMFSYAQQQQVNLTGNNLSLKQIFQQIEKQTKLSVDYKTSDINDARIIKSMPKTCTVEDALSKLIIGSECEVIYGKGHIIIRKRQASQKQKTIKGQVLDESGEPIIGANVLEIGTTNGSITDLEGQFSLDVASNSSLSISFIGYVTQTIKVGAKHKLEVILKEDTETLEEVVVVGYGTVKKKDLTGAVAAVKGGDLAKRKTTQLSTAMQGAVSGVMVTRDNSAPGASASIKVRGVTTMSTSSPLVIIDGVPGDINQVNPNDVESMSVLKDAASASIYGARAASGVIVITTKRAKSDEINLGYSFEYGWEIPTKQPEYVGLQRYMEMTNELRYNDNNKGGWLQTYSEDDIANWVNNSLTNPNKYPNTDWTDLILKGSAPRMSHTVNISGGGKKVKTKASFVYDKVDGLYGDRFYERFMMRVNNDVDINKYMSASLDFNFKRSKDHQPYENPFQAMRYMPPVYAATWSDGRIGEGKTGKNPYGAMLNGGTKDSWYNQIGGKAALNLKPIKGLTISGVVAPIYNFNKFKSFRKAAFYTLPDDPNVKGGFLEGYSTTMLSENRNDSYNVTIQAIASYLKTIGKHDLNFMAGYETYYAFSEGLSASRDQYELTNYPYLDLGPKSLRDNGGNANEIAYRSWFGRIIYSFANRYLFQANIRYDGSSRFHKDSRWGAFPSFSAGWVLSEEKFIKQANIDWLSFLKLRASWGTLGNERIGSNYPYQASINFSNVLFYQNGQALSSLSAAQWAYAIQNISWETTESFDIGLDAQFFRNRLRFSADFYKKKTKDMLLALEIPDYVGFDNPQKNTGDMNTTGYDIDLGWNDQVGDWRYGVSVNFSDFVSKMGNLGGTEFLGSKVKKEGSEFNEWYGYVSEGLYQTEEEVKNSAVLNKNVTVGDVKYKDISGPEGKPDGKISSEYDRVLLGGSLPRYMFGGNVNVAYKNFDLSVAFQGVGKQNAMLSRPIVEPLKGYYSSIPGILDGNYWSTKNSPEQNMKAQYPRLTNVNANANYEVSDFWMFNGRYFRMKNITLGYTLPKSWLASVGIKHVRAYVSANDLFCISKYPKGWDPEMGVNSYPITATLLFGVSVNF